MWKVLDERSACHGCLKEGHDIDNCENRIACSEQWPEFHHPSLHKDEIVGNGHSVRSRSAEVLLPVMHVTPDSKYCKTLCVLWDSAADISFITHSKANQLRLQRKPVTLKIITAGDKKDEFETTQYTLKMRDTNHQSHSIDVYGLDRITSPIPQVNLAQLLNEFDDVPTNYVTRPAGDVDVLIGSDYAGFQPVQEKVSQHLVISNNIFGRGIGGKSSSTTKSMDENSVVAASRVNIIRVNETIEQFMSIESMGVQCEPRCGNCRCGTCPIGGKPYTIKEERESSV